MTDLLDLWSHQPLWFWWALGAILIALEILSTTTYLLWPGIAAFLVGLLVMVVPSLDGRVAIFLFAVLAVASTLVWKRWGPGATLAADEGGTLNRRAAHYIGRAGVAAEDFAGTRGAIRIDDTRWTAVTVDGSEPRMGEPLTVTGADGTALQVMRAAA